MARILTSEEISTARTLRAAGKAWGDIAKALHTRKAVVLEQARGAGIVTARPKVERPPKPPALPIKWYKGAPEKKPYRARGQWASKWQLWGHYLFIKLDSEGFPMGETRDSIGWSNAYAVRNYDLQQSEAINYAVAQIAGDGGSGDWEIEEILEERWIRY